MQIFKVLNCRQSIVRNNRVFNRLTGLQIRSTSIKVGAVGGTGHGDYIHNNVTTMLPVNKKSDTPVNSIAQDMTSPAPQPQSQTPSSQGTTTSKTGAQIRSRSLSRTRNNPRTNQVIIPRTRRKVISSDESSDDSDDDSDDD